MKIIFERPIGTLMCFIILMITGIVSSTQLVTQLIPTLEIPEIIIKVEEDNYSALEIERNVLRIMRDRLKTLKELKNIESKAINGKGEIKLFFELGTSMDFALFEVNEKIDALYNNLPDAISKPIILKALSSSLPVLKLSVLPKFNTIDDFIFIQNVLKRRFESIEGVALIDMNGVRDEAIIISLDRDKMLELNLSIDAIEAKMKTYNLDVGNISVKDGNHRFSINLASDKLISLQDIKNIDCEVKDGFTVKLGEVGDVIKGARKVKSIHAIDQNNGIVFNIHQKEMFDVYKLKNKIVAEVEKVKKQFPELNFVITQDQTNLLKVSIENLNSTLLIGGFFTILVVILFMNNIKIPILLSITIPISVLLSFNLFYLFDLSINIITLGGMALGIGMLIDNSIIVIENITSYSQRMSVRTSCIKGVLEIIPALISSTLTTLAIFVPLIFLEGIAGSLLLEQAIALSSIMGSSLLVSFILIPLLFYLIFRKDDTISLNSKIYNYLESKFILLHHNVHYRAKTLLFSITVITLFNFVLVKFLPLGFFPKLKYNEYNLVIEWDDGVSLIESKKRVEDIYSFLKSDFDITMEYDLGETDFYLQNNNSTLQTVMLHIEVDNYQDVVEIEQLVNLKIRKEYPKSILKSVIPKNALQSLLPQLDEPFFQLKIRNKHDNSIVLLPDLERVLSDGFLSTLNKGEGTQSILTKDLKIDTEKLYLLQIEREYLMKELQVEFGDYFVTNLTKLNKNIPIILKNKRDSNHLNPSVFIFNRKGVKYPISHLYQFEDQYNYASIIADRKGVYHDLFTKKIIENEKVKSLENENISIDIDGQFIRSQQLQKRLFIILLISVLLLYLILVAQFESFIQPLYIIISLPLGISGSIFMLYITGQTLNFMSLIGIIIMLGIMVNDAILKVDTVNRMKKNDKKKPIYTILLEASKIRFKPILMTSLTTILALVPLLFSSGLGADLQKPMALAIIGGLSFGTLSALFFIPSLIKLNH